MIRSQTFKLGKYKIILFDGVILGFCDIPDGKSDLYLYLPTGNTEQDLGTCLHEAAHAEGVSKDLLDGERDFTEHQARLLWRMGWRKTS